jgi:glycosyltransferase involved in cell wall biosynthesis
VNTPLVSVIIPAFNAAPWIRESVNSVILQTYGKLEIIVVDDGSTDNTAVLLGEFSDPRIHVIRQPQSGAAAARNTGLSIAVGDYIQFLDADDLLSAEKIELQVHELGVRPPRSVASCEWMRLDTQGIHSVPERSAWRLEEPIEWLISSLSGGGMMQPAAWLVPRAVIEATGLWNESLTLHDDGEYFARVLTNTKQNVFVEKARVIYRSNPSGLSSQRNRKAAESALAVCRARHSIILERRSDLSARAAIATQYAQFVYEFAHSAPDLAQIAQEEIVALRTDPLLVIGGRAFRATVRMAGFQAAMQLRAFAQRLKA